MFPVALLLLVAAAADGQGINYTQCVFPFSFGGAIQYSCIQNLTGVTDINNQYGCYQYNRTGAICLNQPQNYSCPVVSPYTAQNNSFPTMSVCSWIVIMQKPLGSTYNWSLPWSAYKSGFGTPGQDLWLGLEQIHQLTTSGTNYQLRVELLRNGLNKWYSGTYWFFSVGDETTTQYTVTATGYVGGDSMTDGFNPPSNPALKINGMKFSTYDADNDNYSAGSCSVLSGSVGWWFNNCYFSLLTSGSVSANVWPNGTTTVSRFSVLASRVMILPQ